MIDETTSVSVVIPNWNGRHWLPGCLDAVARQELAPDEVIVVDNGSSDGSLEYLRREHAAVRVLTMGENTGFAHAANAGLRLAEGELVALINTDVVLEPDWLRRLVAAIVSSEDIASAACKMLDLTDPDRVYDAGDVLRRDGACEQRGRFERDDGRWDQPGEVFGACAGAALYRRRAVLDVGGFEERYFAYLEDVDLAVRLGLAGWRCRYEPAVALHAGGGSSGQLPHGHDYLVERNTLFLVARFHRFRWLPLVAYRQAGWAWHAVHDRRMSAHLRGALAGLAMLPRALRDRRALLAGNRVPIEVVVQRRPIRGPRAGGHPSARARRS